MFTPEIAGLGGAFGRLIHDAGYALQLPGAAFALVGMGGLLAATTHSPLLAMILIFEISLNYTLMPPLMVVAVISTISSPAGVSVPVRSVTGARSAGKRKRVPGTRAP